MTKMTLQNLVILLTASSALAVPQVREVPFPYRTIQAAVDAAVDGDTVIVHPGVYTGEGNRDIDFGGKAITIRSEDPDEQPIVAATIIDCQGSPEEPHRAFILANFEGPDSIIAGFTIMNGHIQTDGPPAGAPETEEGTTGGDGEDGYGGAIYCAGSAPTIRNCVIINCTAAGGTGGAGAPGEPGIPPDPGDPNDPNDDVPGVPPTEGGAGGNGGAGFGGAIYCDPNSGPTIVNCRISDCTALGGRGGKGGKGGQPADPNDPNGPDGADGEPGPADGGGIYVGPGSAATIIDCFFENCSASVPGEAEGEGEGQGTTRGGAIFYGDGYSGTFAGDVNNCRATLGAGIFCDANSTFTLTGNNINACSGTDGVGVYCGGTSVLTITDCSITNGTGGSGVGIYCGPDCYATITRTQITNNSGDGDGVAIYCQSGPILTVVDCNILESNSGGAGGAVYAGAGGQVEFENCRIAQSTAIGMGGAIYCGGGDLSLTNCQITESSTAGDGGAIFYGSGGQLSLVGCEITNSTTTGGFGGAVYGGNPTAEDIETEVLIHDCLISGAKALYGGGICLAGSNSTVSDCNISGNEAEYGGGAFWHKSKVTIENCNITDNIAQAEGYCSGGGLYLLDCFLSADYIRVMGNSAVGFGGGIVVNGPTSLRGTPQLHNCLVVGNTAGLDGGGVSISEDAKLTIANCTVVGNQVTDAQGTGGGLNCYAATVDIINSIFWGNSAPVGTQLAVGDPLEPANPPAAIDAAYSDIQGGELAVFVAAGCTVNWDASNIAEAPLFTEGYHLQQKITGDLADSPCVDAGSDLADSLGLQRYFSTRTDDVPDANIVDMGYHYRVQGVTCDCDLDGDMDFDDLNVLFSYWLEDRCDLFNNCEGADVNLDKFANFLDFALCVLAYSPPERIPPTPNPSAWAEEPHQIVDPDSGAANVVSMTAVTASDPSGVQYLFVCTAGPGHDSGWQDSPTYIDSGLESNTLYTYKVKTRDKSPRGNETEWSAEVSVLVDASPPTPNPSLWKRRPFEYYYAAADTYYHGMEAEAATDPSGVEYLFYCIDTGQSSGWRDSPVYGVPVPGPGLFYTYIVKTRDKSVVQNEGLESEPATVGF